MHPTRNVRISCLLTCACLAWSNPTVAAPAETTVVNLVRNGRFDEVDEGLPAHWALDGKQEAGVDSSGVLQVKIVKAADNDHYGEIRQTIPVKPNMRYRVEGRIKATAVRIAFLQVKRRQGSKELERITTAWNGNDWTAVQNTFHSGLADNIQVLCRYRQQDEHVGETVWFDDVLLREAEGLPRESVHEPRAVATFHSIGCYWKPNDGAPDNVCQVRYRTVGNDSWNEALPLWFDPNPHEGLPEHTEEYRGSIVHLQPATEYEIELRLAKTGTTRRLRASTWSEAFPVQELRTLDGPGVIDEGGSATDGYLVYTADKLLDAGEEREWVLRVEAPYVILRGLRLRGGQKHGIVLETHHVVVEDCDISGWGTTLDDGWGANLDSAIYSNSPEVEQIIIQRCHLHDPRSDANSWQEEARNLHGEPSQHPVGPQGISLCTGRGNYVIRDNRITSTMEHMFNDGLGEVRNGSFAGFPNRDSDIYGNFVSHCWDDGLEIEGANMNVRVWRNATDVTMMSLAGATTSLGPVYFWRNISLRSRWGPSDDDRGLKGGGLLKLGQRRPEFNGGRMYIFHNTAYQPPPWPGQVEPSGVRFGLDITGSDYEQRNMVSRNNVLECRRADYAAIKDPSKHPTNDFDWDLFFGQLRAAEGVEQHGSFAKPEYEQGPDRRLWLRPGSPGHDAGQPLPNFNDDFHGNAPDMGAIEMGDETPLPATWPEFPAP